MKRIASAVAAVVLLLAAAFGWAWVDRERGSRRMYAEAAENLSRGDYAAAVKGDQSAHQGQGGYYFGVGFQDVVDVWSRAPAFLRPRVYRDALEAISEAIDARMSEEQLAAMIRTYATGDARYLPRARLRLADLLFARGAYAEAQKRYAEALPSFVDEPDTARTIEGRIDACRKALGGAS
jgi:hypothetical protein